MAQKNIKQYIYFFFWSAGCSVLRAEGFSCSLDVLNGGLGIRKLQFWFKKEKKIKKFQLYFFQFFIIKTLDMDPYSLGMLDPAPD
jgi:hypothetical protein